MPAAPPSTTPAAPPRTQIVVNSGGELQASDSTFAISQVSLADGSILNSGDLTNNVFNTTLYTPILDVPLLTNNQSFEDVDINPATAWPAASR